VLPVSGRVRVDVQHDHLVLPVRIEVGQVPVLARSDLVEPKRCVRVVGPGDAAHRAGRVERIDQSTELRSHEPDAVQQKDSLIAFCDQRGVIDGSTVYRNEVLDVERAVSALPGRQIVKERRRAFGCSNRVSPCQDRPAADDAAVYAFSKTGRQAAGRCHALQAIGHPERVGSPVVQLEREHVVHNSSTPWSGGMNSAVTAAVAYQRATAIRRLVSRTSPAKRVRRCG
jgi:hypothetical protein